MAKIDLSKYDTVTAAAKAHGIKPRTLGMAIDRGDAELVVGRTASGFPVVSLTSVKNWAKAERKPGRKPGK